VSEKFGDMDLQGDAALCFADFNNDAVFECLAGNNKGELCFYAAAGFSMPDPVLPGKEKKQDDTEIKIRKAAENFDNIEALSLISDCRDPSREIKQIRTSCRREMKKKPLETDSLLFKEAEQDYNKAVDFYIENKFSRAAEQFDKVLKIAPAHKEARIYKKRAEEKQQAQVNKIKAAEYYKKAAGFYDKKKWDQAFSCMEKAYAAEPETYQELYAKYSNEYYKERNKQYYDENKALAEKMIREKKYREACSLLRDLREKYPFDGAVSGLWEKNKEYFNFEKKETRQAGPSEQIQPAAVPVDPQAVKEHFRNGMKFYTMGQYEKAVFEWERVLELDPGHVMARRNIEKAREKNLTH
jgi:tetratricopeptide (TPR) repeat protein